MAAFYSMVRFVLAEHNEGRIFSEDSGDNNNHFPRNALKTRPAVEVSDRPTPNGTTRGCAYSCDPRDELLKN